MIIGIGTDIVQLNRIDDLLKQYGSSFTEKILSAEEAACMPANNRTQWIGGRFAVKEALVKALGGRDFDFRQISVLNLPGGCPYVKEKAVIAGILDIPAEQLEIFASLSHEKDYCTAVVLAEKLS